MKFEYIQEFENKFKLKLTNPSGSSNKNQDIECLLCGNVFNAMPYAKKRAFKEHRLPGCPKCTSKEKHKDSREETIIKLEEKGIILLEPYINNNTKILVKNTKCACGGTPWKASPDMLLQNNTFCTPCHLNNTQYIKELENIDLKLTNLNIKMSEHQDIECLLCGNIFNATPKSKIQNFKIHGKKGCPKCTKEEIYGSFEERTENVKRELEEKGFEILEEITDIKNQKLLVKNIKCSCGGTEFRAKIGNLRYRNVKCPPCDLAIRRPNQCKANTKNIIALADGLKEGFELYKAQAHRITEVSKREFVDYINPNNLNIAAAGEEDAHHVDHIVSIKYCYLNDIPPEICGHKDNLRVIEATENIAKNSKVFYFPDIFEPYVDFVKINKEFKSLLSKIDEKLVFEDSKLIGTPITAISHDKKVAIFFVGLDEFSEQVMRGKDTLNNLRKSIIATGYKSIIVFEDEFINKKSIVLNRIKNALGLNILDNGYARNCIIKPINSDEKNKFLEEFHLQGRDKFKDCLGAFLNNVLVGVMTFGAPRVALGQISTLDTNSGRYEIGRFCSRNRIVGLGSKMLQYFKSHNNWKEIYTYADLRWGNGDSYIKMGMTYVNDTIPGYYYIINDIRKHRFGFTKSNIKDMFPDNYYDELTEYDNMLRNGIDRIWDCGSAKYMLKREDII